MSHVMDDSTHLDREAADDPEHGHSHTREERPSRPVTLTLTYENGRTVSLDLNHEGRDPVKGVVWGEAVEQLAAHGVDVVWRNRDELPESGYTWIARTHSSPAATICRWENGCLICS